VRIVTRTVEVERPIIRTVEVQVPTEPRSADEWSEILETFSNRLAQGRVYRRDLPTLAPAVRRLVEVWNRTIEPLASATLKRCDILQRPLRTPAPADPKRSLHRRPAPRPPDDPDRRVSSSPMWHTPSALCCHDYRWHDKEPEANRPRCGAPRTRLSVHSTRHPVPSSAVPRTTETRRTAPGGA